MSYSLFISYDGLTGSGSIFLDGANIAAPVRGSRYSPGRGVRSVDASGRELITEEVTIELAGNYRSITDWVTAINARLEVAKAGYSHNPTSRLLLVVREADDTEGYYWFSEITETWLQLDQAGLVQRATGQQLLTLRVTRLDRWESTNSVFLSLVFPDGGNQLSQGYMLNHCDSTAGHTNWGFYTGSLAGDLPAKVLVQFRTSQGGLSLGDAFLGCGWSDVGLPSVANFLPTIEETDMTAGAGVVKQSGVGPLCSGGNYASFTWSTSAETQLFKFPLPTALYPLSQGRPYKPFIRLQTSMAYCDLWLKLKVLAGASSAPIYETEYVFYHAGSQYINFPPIYLPPEGTQETQQLEVGIYAFKSSSSAYMACIDFFQAWPIDGGLRFYHDLDYVAGNGQIYDAPSVNRLFWSNNTFTQNRAVYTAYGAPILAHPAKTNVFAFFHLQAGTSWVIDDQIQLWLTAQPAKRNL